MGVQITERKGDRDVSEYPRFGTEDALSLIAQREGNGAIADLPNGGRPVRDGGQAVKSSKGYGAEWDAHEKAGKAPSFPASRIELGSARARIAKDRRGSDAVGPDHGPLPVPDAAFVVGPNPRFSFQALSAMKTRLI